MLSDQKFKQYLKDLLFPPFSERELITLVYLIVLMVIVMVISNSAAVVDGIIDAVKRLTFSGSYGLKDFATALPGFLELVLYGLGTFVTVWIVWDVAVKQRKESLETKQFAASVFYAVLSLTSMGALLQSFGFSFVRFFLDRYYSGVLVSWR